MYTCEYDYTIKSDQAKCKAWLSQRGIVYFRFISEEQFKENMTEESFKEVVISERNVLINMAEGKDSKGMMEICFMPGLNGESWFYIQAL